jgi:hypothetical protein
MSALVDRCDRCGAWLKPMLPEQHRAVEAVYHELSQQADYPPGSGQRWDAWSWHQIMLGLFAEEKGWSLPVYVPTPSGAALPIWRMKQSRLTVRQGQELKHFVRAYALDRGVVLREPVET